ncbi:MAG: ABC transporter permease [Methylacidiphilales bacterium]|nr:ABC transporter permease [Candidatus Methylacidiphilales bacterium]
MLQRLKTLIIKELLSFLNSPQGKQILILPVILQTLIFPFAATLEVKNMQIVVFNQDNGKHSLELLQRVSALQAISSVQVTHSDREFERSIVNQETILGIKIPSNFSSQLELNRNSNIQLILDGRKSNSAQILNAYIHKIIFQYAQEISLNNKSQEITVTNFFNPNLEFLWHLMPSLIAIIASIGCLMVTGLSIAREKEEGTFDQLLVSPLEVWVIMFGKLIPGLLIALFQGTLVLGISIVFFRLPLTGSITVLYIGFILFGLSVVGIGLFISSISNTQQQAFLGIFSILSPMVILSGYLSPIENMPFILRCVAYLNPLTHFIQIVKGVLIKSYGITDAMLPLLKLFILSLLSLYVTFTIFKKYKED